MAIVPQRLYSSMDTFEQRIQPYVYSIDKCYALLTGDDGRPNLPFIYKDLMLMQHVLFKLNFDVDNPCLNQAKGTSTLTRSSLDAYIKSLAEKKKDVYTFFLFYYSGHGNSRGILLSSGECVEYNVIIQKFSSLCSDKPKAFIFDCCRTSEEKEFLIPNAYRMNTIPDHVIIVYACMSDERCFGDDNGSEFTKSLACRLYLKLRSGTRYPISFFDLITEVMGTTKPRPVLVSRLSDPHLHFRVRGKSV